MRSQKPGDDTRSWHTITFIIGILGLHRRCNLDSIFVRSVPPVMSDIGKTFLTLVFRLDLNLWRLSETQSSTRRRDGGGKSGAIGRK